MRRAASGRHRGLQLQDDAMGGRDGYRRHVRSIAPGGGPTPLTKRLGPKHWAALDYAAGGFTTLILFLEGRRGLARADFPPDFRGTRYWPVALGGPVALLLVMAGRFSVGPRRRRPMVLHRVLRGGPRLRNTLTL